MKESLPVFPIVMCLLFAAAAVRAGEQPVPGNAAPVVASFSLKADAASTSAGIFDNAGRLVRQLWAMEPRKAGKQQIRWDGLDVNGQPAPPGEYEFRVVINNSTYRNVGVLGNTGVPPSEPGHVQHNVSGMCADSAGNLYTANGWEEAGHDFKVFDPAGATLYHARYQMRNGNPNGAPYSIATDDAYIYCGMQGWANDQWKSRSQIQRFRIEPPAPGQKQGTLEKFTDPALAQLDGHIQLYEWPEKQLPEGTSEDDAPLMKHPIRALAIGGDTIFAIDCLGSKIQKFNKVTGQKQGEFPVKRLPAALAIDKAGKLWVGHGRTTVSVYSQDGQLIADKIGGLGDVKSLAFGPDALLYVADGKAKQVKIYDVSTDQAKLARTFGQPAKPGDWEPSKFYSLSCATVDSKGNLFTAAPLSTGGVRLAKFSPDGACLWEHMGLMFCDLGKYSPTRPDEFITHRFHRFMLADKNAGEWQYRGTILDGDASYINAQHGVMSLLKLGGSEFIFQCYGDGLQVYRRTDDGLYRLVSAFGGNNPFPNGVFNDWAPQEKRGERGQWTWTDQNANNKVEDDEVVWFRPPGKARYNMFGMNIDVRGNVLYCEHHTGSTWELPMSGLDGSGNPVYDWRLAREIIARDQSPIKFFPLMAIRAEDGSIYAFGRSGQEKDGTWDAWPRPGGKTAGYAWMGGWALLRYSREGSAMWAAKLPEVCVGMDVSPGNKGVMLGHFESGRIYHFLPDGLFIGQCEIDKAANGDQGWMDNTSAVAVERDPRDGILDVFGEDSWLNRLLWYRADDRDIKTVTGKFRK